MTSTSSPTPRCYVCGTTDPDAFNPSLLRHMAGEYDGRRRPATRCAECERKRQRAYYAANRERILVRLNAYYADRRSLQGVTVRRFRVKLAPGLPRMPRTWERRQREDAPKWWERGSLGKDGQAA